MNADQVHDFDQWAIVEVMGHRVLAGHVTAANIAGAGMLKVDVPATASTPAFTQYVGPGSVFAITPATEEYVRKHAEQQYRWSRPQHVALPAPAAETIVNQYGEAVDERPISDDVDVESYDAAMAELTAKCTRCDGRGKIVDDEIDQRTYWLPCPECSGSGFAVNA